MARPRTEPRPETDTGQTDAGETGGFPSLADVTPGPLALTGLNQPLWLQNSTYPAALDRQAIAAAFSPGVLGSAELVVTQRAAGANLSVDVAAGRVVVPMTDAPNQGSALCVSTAVNNLTVAGAPGAGLSRIDLVIARVYDASLIGGSINGWQLEVVTGTAASSPAVPATPTSSIVLARIAVASGQASVATANIADNRVTSAAEISYTQVAAPTPITATTAAAANTVVTDAARTYDGAPIMVEFYAPQGQTPVTANSLMFNLWDAATDLGYAGQVISPAAAVTTVPVSIRRRLVPAAGSHTFKIAAWVPNGGSGNVGAGPGGIGQLVPAFLRITRA